MKVLNDKEEEIEVYTAEEVQAKIAEATKAKDDEFGKTKAQIEAERDQARKALTERAGEFKQFRRLTDEQAAKLSEAERTIYENGLVIEEERKKRAETEKKIYDGQVTAALKAKVGNDEKLLAKMRETWDVIGINALTPEEIEKKANMVVGALRTAEPDLMASVFGAGAGGVTPPEPAGTGEKSFADTERGKEAAKFLGLKI